jgi:hypothetical protein
VLTQISVCEANERAASEINKLEIQLNNINQAVAYLRDCAISEKYNIDISKLDNAQSQIINYNLFQEFSNKILCKKISQIILKIKCKIEKKYKYEFEKKTIGELKKQVKTQTILFQHNQKITEKINTVTTHHFNLTKSLNENRQILNEKRSNYQELMVKKTTLTEKMDYLGELQNTSTINTIELAFLNMYQKCVDKKKGISQTILSELCNELTSKCNLILHEIADFEIEITIGKSKGNSEQSLRMYTLDGGVRIPAAMASGYQKFTMDMIMRVVLTTILCKGGSNNISNPNMLILDEGFGCLDSKNFIEVAGILKKLKHNFKCMVIITHIGELKSYADDIIDIERVKSASKITWAKSVIDESRVASMLKMDLVGEMGARSAELVASRVVINAAQLEKREKIAAKKAEIAANKAKKDEEIKNKRAAVAANKAAVVDKKELLALTMSDPIMIKQHIIHTFDNEDNMPCFTCKACCKTYIITEGRLNNHINASSYMAKHKKYIKSIL